MNIYQEIWDADMQGNGIRPISSGETGNESEGYVVVNTESCEPQHHVIQDLHIPGSKKRSYELVERLFNNYTLNQKKREFNNTLDESREIEEFLNMAIESPPLKKAKQFIEQRDNAEYTQLQWYTHLHDIWFRTFQTKSGKDLSGFEHVFIGEQKGKKLGGHHFWYKYWLEDNADANETHTDQIQMTCSVSSDKTSPNPDVVTVGYKLEAYDYEKKEFVKLTKNIGGFFVGLSAEGILALGTARFTPQGYAPKDAIINGTHYVLELFRSPDNKSLRTFYPVYIPN